MPAKSENGYRTYNPSRFREVTSHSLLQVSGLSLEENRLLSQDDQALLPHLVRQLDCLEQERDQLRYFDFDLTKNNSSSKGKKNRQ